MPTNPRDRARGYCPLGKTAPRGAVQGGMQAGRLPGMELHGQHTPSRSAFSASLSSWPGLPGGPWPCCAPFAMPWTLTQPSVWSRCRPGVRKSRPSRWQGGLLGSKIPEASCPPRALIEQPVPGDWAAGQCQAHSRMHGSRPALRGEGARLVREGTGLGESLGTALRGRALSPASASGPPGPRPGPHLPAGAPGGPLPLSSRVCKEGCRSVRTARGWLGTPWGLPAEGLVLPLRGLWLLPCSGHWRWHRKDRGLWPRLAADPHGKRKALAGAEPCSWRPTGAEAGALLHLSFPPPPRGGGLLATLGGCSFRMVFLSVERRRWEGGGPGVLTLLHVGPLPRELGGLGPRWKLQHLPSPALRPRLDLRWCQH